MRTKLKGLVTLMLALLVQISFAQQKKVTGTVTDASTGEPLPGVNVLVKGTNNGTVTDFDGKFSIMATPDDVLVFSYVGYQDKEVKVGNQNVINVQLQSGEQLEEVVIDISGKEQESKKITYSVQAVSSKTLDIADIPNVQDALTGKVAGAQVWSQAGSKLGEAPKIRIRGRVSLSSDSNPLYVVDGVPVGDPSMIDPENVERVEVLKGVNATAIYGQRGVNGVVVITTKKAKGETFGVEISSKMSFEKVAYLPKYQNWYGQGYDGELEWTTAGVDFPWFGGEYPEWSSNPVFSSYPHIFGTWADESWGPKFDGREYLPWYAWWPDSKYFGQTAKWEAKPDNIKNFYDSGVYMKNTAALFFSKGKSSGRISFSNLDQKGIIPYSKYSRNFISGNYKFEISNKFRGGLGVIYSGYRRHGDFDDEYGNQTSGSFNSWFARDLDMAKQKELIDLKTPEGYYVSWNMWPVFYISLLGNARDGDFKKPVFWFNHYTWLRDYDRNGYGKQLTGNIWGEFDLNKSLTAKILIGHYSSIRNNNYFLPHQIEYSSGHNLYVHWVNSFGIANNQFYETNYNGFIYYKKDISEKLSFNAMLGTTWLEQDGYGTSTWMTPDDLENGLIVPDDYIFSNTKQRVPTNRSELHRRVFSVYGESTFGYNDLLFLTLTGRQDWSSSLPKDNNGYFYPSVGLTFNFSELEGFQDNEKLSDIFSSGKFRINIAQVGSDVGAHLIYPTYNLIGAGSYHGNATMVAPSYIVDPNLVPAINTAFETGLDLRFLENRAGLNITYYYEKRKDEIIFQQISSGSGYVSYLTNGGTSHRSGVELELSGSPIRNNNFSWNVNLNLSYNKSIVDEVPGEAIEMPAPGGKPWSDGDTWGRVTLVHKEGMEWGLLKGYDILRDDDGNPVIDPASGLYITTESPVYFGSILPRWTGGFTNVLNYKDFSLSAHFVFQKGGKFFSGSEVWGYFSGLFEETGLNGDRDAGVDVEGVDLSGNSVQKNVSADSYFKQFHRKNIAGPFVHDASFLKLRELSFTYNLPKKVLGNYLKGASVSLIGTNVWMIAVAKDNYHRWDPSEISQSYGEDAQLPGTRRFGLNIKLTF